MEATDSISWLRIAGSLEHLAIDNFLSVSMLAIGDGIELIHHHLRAGTYWALEPEPDTGPLEALYIVDGRLNCHLSHKHMVLTKGDSLAAHPVREQTIFHAEVDTNFIYISSQPVFHRYSTSLEEVKTLAVQIEEKDGYTSDHCSRIMEMSLTLGKCMNLKPSELYCLQFGSFFHDIGKLYVPDSILNKPGALTSEEWRIMKGHPAHGGEALMRTGLRMLADASLIVEQHHERYNGSGYPLGLSGSDIHLGAAIVAVIDSYDAMTTDRSYRRAKSKEEALMEIRKCRGTLYHPRVVDCFLDSVPLMAAISGKL